MNIRFLAFDEQCLMLPSMFSGRSAEKLKVVETYLRANRMFRNFEDSSEDPVFSEVHAVICYSLFIITRKKSPFHWITHGNLNFSLNHLWKSILFIKSLMAIYPFHLIISVNLSFSLNHSWNSGYVTGVWAESGHGCSLLFWSQASSWQGACVRHEDRLCCMSHQQSRLQGKTSVLYTWFFCIRCKVL